MFSDRIDVNATGYDSVVPAMLSGLSLLLIALVVILVLSASMSTLSSLVIASSSILTIDFLKELVFRKMEEKKQVFTMRILIVVFIAVSSVLALIQYKKLGDLYRPVDGSVLGRPGGFFPVSLYVCALFQEGDKGFLLGLFPVQLRADDRQYFLPSVLSCDHAVAHQLRRHCHACRSCDRSGGKSVHSEAGQKACG